MSESVVQETTVMRPPTMDDLAAVVDLINAVSNHEWGADQVDEQFMKDDWQRLGLDLVTDARVMSIRRSGAVCIPIIRAMAWAHT
jgi:hypothetical protein